MPEPERSDRKRHFPGCANPFKFDDYPGLCYADPARKERAR